MPSGLLPHQVWNMIGCLRRPIWALMFHCIVMLREPEQSASLSRTDKSVMIKCPMRSSSFPFWEIRGVPCIFTAEAAPSSHLAYATRNWNTRGLVLWVWCYHVVPVRMELDSRRRALLKVHQVHLLNSNYSVGYEPFKDGTTDCDWRMDKERIRKLESFAWRIRWLPHICGSRRLPVGAPDVCQ